MIVNPLLLCILLTNLLNDDSIGISSVTGQNTNAIPVRGLVNPNPVTISSQMTVTCSKDSIGGVSQLVNLSKLKRVNNINMYRQVAGADKVTLAKYDAREPEKYLREIVIISSQPANITKSNYKFEGRGDNSHINDNVETMKITLTVPVVTCELIATYICEFLYPTDSTLNRMSFMENVTSLVEVGEVIMTATQSRQHYGSYSVGESISFTCKINGTQNMTVEWEAAQCSAPTVYKNLPQLHQNFVIKRTSRNLTQTKCYDPVREYIIELEYVTTDAFCSIRCVAYDKDGKKIEKYRQRLDQNIVNGTKSVATKKPLSDWGHILVVSILALGVIGAVVLGWRCCRKYKLCTIEYHDSTLSTTEEPMSVHTRPDTSDKPSFASTETSTIPATPEVPEASLIKRFSVAYTNLFDKPEPGKAGGRQQPLFFSEIKEDED